MTFFQYFKKEKDRCRKTRPNKQSCMVTKSPASFLTFFWHQGGPKIFAHLSNFHHICLTYANWSKDELSVFIFSKFAREPVPHRISLARSIKNFSLLILMKFARWSVFEPLSLNFKSEFLISHPFLLRLQKEYNFPPQTISIIDDYQMQKI